MLAAPETLDLEPIVRSLFVLDKHKRLVPFEPNWAQAQILAQVKQDYENNKPTRIICLKCRQIGISTITEAIMFGKAVLFPHTEAVVASLDTEQAEYLFDMTKRFYDMWEFKKFYPPKYASKRELYLEGVESDINVKTGENPKAFRGRTYTDAHISEVAFWTKPVEAMNAINQGMASVRGNFQLIESTANGMGNYFEEAYWDAKNGKSEYTAFFFPWWQHYEYIPCGGEGCRDGTCGVCEKASAGIKPRDADERWLLKAGATKAHVAWRRWAIPNKCLNNLDLFHQEYPACVVGSTRVGTDLGVIPIEEAWEAKEGTMGRLVGSHQQVESPVFTLCTKLGYKLTGTADHPIFDPQGGCHELASMEGGSPIQLAGPRFAEKPYSADWFEDGVSCSVDITPEWGRFLGLFMSDGSVYRSGASRRRDTVSLVFDRRDEDLIENSRVLFKEVFGREPTSRISGKARGCVELRLVSRRAAEVLERLGAAGSDGRQVCVPECIWRSPEPVVREFLAGYFEGDGFNGYKTPRVTVFCKHGSMLEDVQVLLAGFGIPCLRRDRPTKNGQGYEYVERVLNLRGEEAVLFNERIGFLSERKRSRSAGGPTGRGRPRIKATMTDEVESVTPAGSAVTYNFTVEGSHAFDANGIKTHNTDEEAFIASGVNAFNLDDLKAVYEPMEPVFGDLVVQRGDVKFVQDPTGAFRIYKAPSSAARVADKQWGEYMIGADACFGVIDGDFAAAHVINRRTKEQLAVFHGRVSPGEFADKLALLGKFYGGNDISSLPMIAVETEGPGLATIERLRSMYPNVWARRQFDTMPGHDRSETKLGWSTSWKTKAYLILTLAELVQRGGLTIHDEKTFKEMRTYSFYGAKGMTDRFGPADIERGKDDLVMSLAITMVCESQESPLGAFEVVDSPGGVIWSKEQEEEPEWE